MAKRYVDLDGPKQGRLFDYGQSGSGKGDAPRNMGPKFAANFAQIDWADGKCVTCGKTLTCTCKDAAA